MTLSHAGKSNSDLLKRRRAMAYANMSTGILRGLALFAMLGSGMIAAGACSGPSGAPTQATPQRAGATTSHAIHVFITQPDGSKRQVNFGPGTDVSFAGSTGTGLGRQAVPMTSDDGGPPVATPPTVADPGTDIEATAWELVARAAFACGGVGALPPWQNIKNAQLNVSPPAT